VIFCDFLGFLGFFSQIWDFLGFSGIFWDFSGLIPKIPSVKALIISKFCANYYLIKKLLKMTDNTFLNLKHFFKASEKFKLEILSGI